jgi:hypothetical protein
MLRAGRVLYLDWAQARIISTEIALGGNSESLTAQHNGYRKIGVLHSRKLTSCDDGHWEVMDRLDGKPGSIHSVRLHWLLPDWEYEFHESTDNTNLPGYKIRIKSPYGWVSLNAGASLIPGNSQPIQTSNFQLVRAGTILFGSGTTSSITGWTSPTYGDKIPALACIFEISQSLPIELKSEWILPSES